MIDDVAWVKEKLREAKRARDPHEDWESYDNEVRVAEQAVHSYRDRALAVLDEIVYDAIKSEERYRTFSSIERRTGLERNVIRAICRRLVDQGRAEFHAGLWDDDGEPAGAGYRGILYRCTSCKTLGPPEEIRASPGFFRYCKKCWETAAFEPRYLKGKPEEPGFHWYMWSELKG